MLKDACQHCGMSTVWGVFILCYMPIWYAYWFSDPVRWLKIWEITSLIELPNRVKIRSSYSALSCGYGLNGHPTLRILRLARTISIVDLSGKWKRFHFSLLWMENRALPFTSGPLEGETYVLLPEIHKKTAFKLSCMSCRAGQPDERQSQA